MKSKKFDYTSFRALKENINEFLRYATSNQHSGLDNGAFNDDSDNLSYDYSKNEAYSPSIGDEEVESTTQ